MLLKRMSVPSFLKRRRDDGGGLPYVEATKRPRTSSESLNGGGGDGSCAVSTPVARRDGFIKQEAPDKVLCALPPASSGDTIECNNQKITPPNRIADPTLLSQYLQESVECVVCMEGGEEQLVLHSTRTKEAASQKHVELDSLLSANTTATLENNINNGTIDVRNEFVKLVSWISSERLRETNPSEVTRAKTLMADPPNVRGQPENKVFMKRIVKNYCNYAKKKSAKTTPAAEMSEAHHKCMCEGWSAVARTSHHWLGMKRCATWCLLCAR